MATSDGGAIGESIIHGRNSDASAGIAGSCSQRPWSSTKLQVRARDELTSHAPPALARFISAAMAPSAAKFVPGLQPGRGSVLSGLIKNADIFLE